MKPLDKESIQFQFIEMGGGEKPFKLFAKINDYFVTVNLFLCLVYLQETKCAVPIDVKVSEVTQTKKPPRYILKLIPEIEPLIWAKRRELDIEHVKLLDKGKPDTDFYNQSTDDESTSLNNFDPKIYITDDNIDKKNESRITFNDKKLKHNKEQFDKNKLHAALLGKKHLDEQRVQDQNATEEQDSKHDNDQKPNTFKQANFPKNLHEEKTKSFRKHAITNLQDTDTLMTESQGGMARLNRSDDNFKYYPDNILQKLRSLTNQIKIESDHDIEEGSAYDSNDNKKTLQYFTTVNKPKLKETTPRDSHSSNEDTYFYIKPKQIPFHHFNDSLQIVNYDADDNRSTNDKSSSWNNLDTKLNIADDYIHRKADSNFTIIDQGLLKLLIKYKRNGRNAQLPARPPAVVGMDKTVYDMTGDGMYYDSNDSRYAYKYSKDWRPWYKYMPGKFVNYDYQPFLAVKKKQYPVPSFSHGITIAKSQKTPLLRSIDLGTLIEQGFKFLPYSVHWQDVQHYGERNVSPKLYLPSDLRWIESSKKTKIRGGEKHVEKKHNLKRLDWWPRRKETKPKYIAPTEKKYDSIQLAWWPGRDAVPRKQKENLQYNVGNVYDEGATGKFIDESQTINYEELKDIVNLVKRLKQHRSRDDQSDNRNSNNNFQNQMKLNKSPINVNEFVENMIRNIVKFLVSDIPNVIIVKAGYSKTPGKSPLSDSIHNKEYKLIDTRNDFDKIRNYYGEHFVRKVSKSIGEPFENFMSPGKTKRRTRRDAPSFIPNPADGVDAIKKMVQNVLDFYSPHEDEPVEKTEMKHEWNKVADYGPEMWFENDDYMPFLGPKRNPYPAPSLLHGQRIFLFQIVPILWSMIFREGLEQGPRSSPYRVYWADTSKYPGDRPVEPPPTFFGAPPQGRKQLPVDYASWPEDPEEQNSIKIEENIQPTAQEVYANNRDTAFKETVEPTSPEVYAKNQDTTIKDFVESEDSTKPKVYTNNEDTEIKNSVAILETEHKDNINVLKVSNGKESDTTEKENKKDADTVENFNTRTKNVMKEKPYNSVEISNAEAVKSKKFIGTGENQDETNVSLKNSEVVMQNKDQIPNTRRSFRNKKKLNENSESHNIKTHHKLRKRHNNKHKKPFKLEEGKNYTLTINIEN